MDTFRLLTFLSLTIMARGDMDDQFRRLYEVYSNHHQYLAQVNDNDIQVDTDSVGISFNCPPSVSPEKPQSVHHLRPGDINVVAALGDSLSTAYAAGAPLFLPVMLNYWGVSASIGGDKNIGSIGTLPNILRQYNADIHGYSTGSGIVFTQPKPKSFNHAVVGATADDLPKQARQLIDHLQESASVDMANDWKFITLFIGGNDLCSGCTREDSGPKAYLDFIEEALRILQDEVPRAFVNLVGVMNAYILTDLGGSLKCNLVHGIVCKCLNKDGGKDAMYDRAKEYQKIVQEAIESGKFDGKDDFTVVYQPFFHDTLLPRDKEGQPDASYFAPDCFHFSQKGQAAQAVANWNALFEPVGEKRLEWVPGEDLICPSVDFPFLYTNVNSKLLLRDVEAFDSRYGVFQLAPEPVKHGGIATETFIIIGVVGGLLAITIVVAIAATATKRRRDTKTSYQYI